MDLFPTSDSRYNKYMLLFAQFGEILAKKIVNFHKVRIFLRLLGPELDPWSEPTIFLPESDWWQTQISLAGA